MILQHSLGDLLVLAQASRHDQLMSELRMFLHDLALIRRQGALLVEHRLLDAQIANKDERARRNEAQLIFLRHLEPLAHKPCQNSHMEAMMDGVLAFHRHVVDVRDSFRTRTKRQDVLCQSFC